MKTIQRPEIRFPVVLALTLLGMVFAFALVFSIYENNVSFGDGLWTAYITLTTIGYGDIYAKTWEGRTVTILTSTFGIGCFGVFTGIIVEKAMQRRFKKMKGEGKFSGEDHLVIVNVPSYEEIKELINELDASPEYQGAPRVIVTSRLPHQDKEIPSMISNRIDGFIMGIPSALETLKRANISRAKACLLLSSASDFRMDDTNTLTACLIEKNWPQIITIVDCARPETLKNLGLFSIDGGVSATGLQMGLLVQELTSQGAFKVFDQLSSNEAGGSQIYISRSSVEKWNPEKKPMILRQLKLAIIALDLSLEILGISKGREHELLLNPSNAQKLLPSDYLVYMAKARFDWLKHGPKILRQLEK